MVDLQWRKIAKDFIHVEDGSQAGGSGLSSDPGKNLIEQDRHEEHSLLIRQMSN